MFTDKKITAFAQTVSDLPDEPKMEALELKKRFDACPEQLRVSLNGVCDDGALLETKVQGLINHSFSGAVVKNMFDPSLAAELDGKATQTALTAETTARINAVSAEQSARTTAVSTEKTERQNADNSLTSQINARARVKSGYYTGSGDTTSKTISVGFPIEAVLVLSEVGFQANSTSGRTLHGEMAVRGRNDYGVSISGSSFVVRAELNYGTNYPGYCNYWWVAWG